MNYIIYRYPIRNLYNDNEMYIRDVFLQEMKIAQIPFQRRTKKPLQNPLQNPLQKPLQNPLQKPLRSVSSTCVPRHFHFNLYDTVVV